MHERGASLEIRNSRKQTPLEVAEHIGEPKAAKLLKALAEGKTADDLAASDASDGEDSN